MNMLVESGGYAIGWGTLALINGGLAQGKNRSGLIWFLLSLLLGPIATLILLFLAKGPSDA
jgi:biotin transporter BioY